MPFLPPRRAAMLAAALTALPFALSAQQTQQPAQQEASAETAAPDLSTVVATVSGEDVTLGEVIMMRMNLPPQYQQLPDDQLFEALVEQAITQRLLAEEGREAGYADTPMARLSAEQAEQTYLAEAKMREVVDAATAEEKLRAEYERRMESMEPAQEVRASHILVPTQEEAQALYDELQGGADFAELANEHGTDGTKERGGDLGWFEKEQMVPAFAEAAFAAEEGVVTEPVQTDFGWHLIKVTGKRDQPAPEFEAVRDEIAQDLASTAAQQAIQDAREGVEVSRPETGLDPSVIRRDDLLTAN